MSVRILIVDDHEVVREGVRIIINRAKRDWEICGEAINGQEAVDAVARLAPDIVLLDMTMPVMSGIDAALQITGRGLIGQVLMFTMHDSGELANEARRVGAKGYVTKSHASRDLVAAIETLLSGGTFFGRPGKPEDPEKKSGPGILFRLGFTT